MVICGAGVSVNSAFMSVTIFIAVSSGRSVRRASSAGCSSRTALAVSQPMSLRRRMISAGMASENSSMSTSSSSDLMLRYTSSS